MNVASLLKTKGNRVVTVPPGTKVVEVCATLMRERIGAVLVRQSTGEIVGVFSERDAVRGLAEQGAGCLDLPVDALMTRQVIYCAPEETVDSLMQRMTDRRIRHVPVVDRGGLIGIVSIGDVVKHRIAEVELETEALRQYIASG
jgi:CBS domain-containing protein